MHLSAVFSSRVGAGAAGIQGQFEGKKLDPLELNRTRGNSGGILDASSGSLKSHYIKKIDVPSKGF